MNNFSIAMKRFGGFLKRNAFYILIVLCIASVATVIGLAVTYNQSVETDASSNDNNNDITVVKPDDDNNNQKPDDNQQEDPIKHLTFLAPCNNGEVTNNYSDTQLVWCPSLKQYATHLALDFTSADQNVYASADGVVKEIGHNDLDGYYVILSHDEGYATKYCSLQEQPDFNVGSKVTQGQFLGKMSTSQGSESLDGAHLHFEVFKDGEQINPLEVIVLSEK